MFLAQLVVCGFIGGQCVLLEDVKGPKPSLEQCKSRQEEMFYDIHARLPYIKFGGSRCIKTNKLHV
jgi:hypothetical protein